MHIFRSLPRFALILLLGLPLAGLADDIDIYDGLNDGSAPNVLFVLDNAANFSSSAATCTYDDGSAPTLNGTAGGIEQCALYNVLNSLPAGLKINIGFMFYNANNFVDLGCASGGNGGCLIRPIAQLNSTTKGPLLAWIKSWVTSGNSSTNVKASGEATAATLQEAWAYFAGKTGLSGRNYTGVTPPNTGCQNDFIIFIGNAFTTSGTPGDGGSTSPSATLANAPGIISSLKTKITVPPGCYGVFNSGGYKPFIGSSSNCGALASGELSCGGYSMGNHTDSSGLYADEWARYMFQTDVNGVYGGSGQKIKTFTIGLLGSSCKPDYPALLSSVASQGGGKYFPTNSYNGIVQALGKILNEVSAINSVFSSSSLPVSVNTQGSYLNQIYMGMFRPDPGGNPRWMGNLKQYQFKWNDSLQMLVLADTAEADAISSGGTGFISPNAISFWTSKNTAAAPDSTGGFWIKNPQGVGQAYDSPDGEVVEKGGAAQQLRLATLTADYTTTPGSATNPRRLYTYCPSGSGCVARLSDSSNTFDTSNSAITTAMLGVPDSTQRDLLMKWMRGQDNKGDELGPGDPVTVRPSIHGDVLHSRPVVLSYGGNPETVVVFYGSNDGVLHAVNGNQTAAIGSVPPGGELWGLILPEFYGKLNRQRSDTPVLKLPSTNAALNPAPKDYFVDGSPGVYQQLNADGTVNKSYLYLSMRRGGRFIYALDVTAPADPKILWKKSSSDSGMDELGQTWSRPKVAIIKGWNHPVLIFGAGYSTQQDNEPPGADAMGRGIFILDAFTGDLVWNAKPGSSSTSCSGSTTQATCQVAGMNYSIPSDITLLDRDHDGYTERLYTADTGGNIWRVDLEPSAGVTPNKWQVNKLAALGCAAGVCSSGVPRKFFFPPSVVPIGSTGAANAYDAVLIGSGDREHPLYSTNGNSAYMVTNRLYMLKDTNTGKDGSGLALITEPALYDATSAPYNNTLSGFYITLGVGEKAVNAPLTASGITYMGTNQPTPPSSISCNASLGTARSYSIDIFSGTYQNVVLEGGGLPPSPVAGIALVDGQKRSFCIGCIDSQSSKKSALENGAGEKDGKKKMSRTYWYKK